MTGLLILNLVLSIGVVVVIVGMLVSAILADQRADIARTLHAVAPSGSDVTAHLPILRGSELSRSAQITRTRDLRSAPVAA
ncbi:MAG TPA: hypothetical protein VN880_01270, partial [Solirubrobacteraceae bacterium]|nr:hypothetical protein [Solirubrobacteraceae bacterium]